MSVSTISQGDSRPPLERKKALIWWLAVLSMCLGGVTCVPILGSIFSDVVLFITYDPIVRLAPHFAASLHPDKTSGWFPLLHCVEFPIFFPLPTISAIVALIGLRQIRRYGNVLLGSCCTEKYLMWISTMYYFALACVAFVFITACAYGASRVIFA